MYILVRISLWIFFAEIDSVEEDFIADFENFLLKITICFIENIDRIIIILDISFNSNNIVGWNFRNKADVTSRDFKYEIADFPNNFIVSYPSRVSRNEFGR